MNELSAISVQPSGRARARARARTRARARFLATNGAGALFLTAALVASLLALAACSGETTDTPPGQDAAVDAVLDVGLPDVPVTASDGVGDAPAKLDVAARDELTADVPPGEFLAPCDDNVDCASGWCIELEDGYVCTKTCDDGCPDDWFCVPVVNTAPDLQFVCKPARRALCEPCTLDAQCLDGYCLSMGEGVAFCSGPCSHDGACPDGYTCEETTSEEEPTLTSSQCLPLSGVCDCGPESEGDERPCLSQNEWGTCWGIATCDADAGWTDCSARVPAAETCDGVDEDCDGLADEDAPEPAEACAITNQHGTCTGRWLCRGGEGWYCTAREPAAESCNYQDDDCNGLTDEPFRTNGTGVYDQEEHCGACGNACAGAWPNAISRCETTTDPPTCVIAECVPGTWRAGEFACVPVESWLCQPCPTADACPVPGDRCLALDGRSVCGEDCGADSVHGTECPAGSVCAAQPDGARQCVPVSGSCSCWRAEQDGATRACVRSNEAGVCGGVETCSVDAGAGEPGWSACSAVEPMAEACNGRDDDCDGAIDEDVTPPVEACAAENEFGRCEGTWACRDDGTGAVDWRCDAATPAAETCNYADDDCDGATDEDFRASDAVPGGEAGAYDRLEHCGVCGYDCSFAIPFVEEATCAVTDGLAACEVVTCRTGYAVSEERDACIPFVPTDDCAPCEDDVQCSSLPGICADLDGGGFCLRTCDTEALDAVECPVGFECREGGTWDVCAPVTGSCTCYQPDHDDVTRACARENEIGLCTGVQSCTVGSGGNAGDAGGWSTCSAAEPAEETCNGRDDDCDGAVDEDVTPPPEDCAFDNEFGRCEGAWSCATLDGVTGWTCDAAQPAAEACNYADDDCDGATDEDFRVGDGGAYDQLGHCGVCGYDCRRAIPYVAEAACVVDGGSAGCEVVTCQPGYGQPPGFDICVPFGAVSDCSPCAVAEHCEGLPGACLEVDAGTFCLRDCAVAADCAGDYDCVGGHCVPKSGSCTCGPGQEGVRRPCYEANVSGVCTGEEICGGVTGWSACSATTPAPEVCGGGDEDCDGVVDEAGALACTVYARDADRDGWGRDTDQRCLCAPERPYDAQQTGDCNDVTPTINPGATERCNGLDDDCDDAVDEEGAQGCQEYARDADGDGAGVAGDVRCLCAAAFPYTAPYAPGDPVDCNDGNPFQAPGEPEACNGVDDDCDGATDEADAIGCRRRFADEDGDGYGAEATAICACEPDLEHPIEVSGDCDDDAIDVNPGADEACGGADEDCDGATDEEGAAGCLSRWIDGDEDGWGAPFTDRCLCEDDGDWTATTGGDCDDGDPTWTPVGVESCGADADCCRPDDVCRYGTCVDPPTACDTDGECTNDTYCDGGECIPWGVGPGGEADPTCARPTVPGLFRPTVQCKWDGPPAGDPYPGHINVLSTAMVADFDFDQDPTTVRPSIVFTSYNYTDGGDQASDGAGASTSYYGVVRVLDGETCQQLYNVVPRRVVGSNPLALGDVDGDGRPEIAAHGVGGGLVVFRWNAGTGAWSLLWESHTAAGAVHRPYARINRWSGPSITDVDSDGSPDVVMASYVYDAQGVLRASNLGTHMYSRGFFPTVADVDLDGAPELVTGDGIWRYQKDASGNGTWQRESYNAASTHGFVAIGDFGDFPVAGLPAGIPEIVVISNGEARVMDLAGRTVFGPYSLPFFPPAPNRGTGGQPTVGDFDGDGRPEFALAGRGAYTIFDLDCQGPEMPRSCRQEGILWSLPTQDYSSSLTGSSIFDFEGDGFAEAVYSDECFTRIYGGLDGEILFSQWRSSCTWYENPVIADTDGDGFTEIVMGSNTNCNKGTACPAIDPYFRGLRCTSPDQCPSGVCSAGFCRCTTDAQCGGTDFVCTAALPNTPGTGQVCRASHPRINYGGLRVYQDTLDNWVNSRTIWNQHAYFVTNVNDDGTIPTGGEWTTNWLDPDLNNHRQNVQGSLAPTLVPDLTIRPIPPGNCDPDGALALQAEVCNRGAAVPGGLITVAVTDGDPNLGRFISLPTTTTAPAPGACEPIAVDWTLPTPVTSHDVWWSADWSGAWRECWEPNNVAVMQDVTCRNLP